jgi:RNA polymerase sigma-70 factor (ECF subfamily)
VEHVRALWDRGRAAWPAIDVPLAVFERVLGTDPDARVHAEDLYLACACVHGDAAAIAAFEDAHRATIDGAIARIDRRPEVVEELRQAMLVRWLVPDLDQPPRLATYTGRGPLSAWVRIAASRAALDSRRGARRNAGDEAIAERAVGDQHDPEVAYLRAKYQPAFTSSLARGLAMLTREQRGMLRLHYVEGMTMDALATMFQTSRAGVHRRVAAARTALFDHTCRLLREDLKLSASELTSMIRLVRSDLDVGLAQLLETAT